MKTGRISLRMQWDLVVWLRKVCKKNGFNFSQALNWIVRQAMEADLSSKQ